MTLAVWPVMFRGGVVVIVWPSLPEFGDMGGLACYVQGRCDCGSLALSARVGRWHACSSERKQPVHKVPKVRGEPLNIEYAVFVCKAHS